MNPAKKNNKLTLISLTRNHSKTELFYARGDYCGHYLNSFPFHIFPDVDNDYIVDKKIAYPFWNTVFCFNFGIPEFFISYRRSGKRSNIYSPTEFLRSNGIDVTESEVDSKINSEALRKGVCDKCQEGGFAFNCAFTRGSAIVNVLLEYFGNETSYLSTVRLFQVFLIAN